MQALRSHHHGLGDDLPEPTGNISDLPTEDESRDWLEKEIPGYKAEREAWLQERLETDAWVKQVNEAARAADEAFAEAMNMSPIVHLAVDDPDVQKATDRFVKIASGGTFAHASELLSKQAVVTPLYPSPVITFPIYTVHYLSAPKIAGLLPARVPVSTEKFYVAVTKNGQPNAKPGNIVLAAGPFDTKEESEAYYEPVKRMVKEQYDAGGMSHWYGYSIVGVREHNAPGKLNIELGITLQSQIPVHTAILSPGDTQVINVRNGRKGIIDQQMNDGNYRVYIGAIDLGYIQFRAIETYTADALHQLNPSLVLSIKE